MAIYIKIKKREETADKVVYEFGSAEDIVGTVELGKKTGQVILLDMSPGRREDFYLPRVISVLERHFLNGEFPDATCYAA